MALLQNQLKQISRCEQLVFKNEDWYARYGYLYYEMMAALVQTHRLT